MDSFSLGSEKQSLLKNRRFNLEWNNKVLKWIFYIILIGLLLLVAFYIVQIFINNEIQPDSDATINKIESLHISSIATTNDDFLQKCAPKVDCDRNAKYRSANGSCNNLQIPTWGAAKTPFFRMMNPNYSDGFHSLRVQTNGSALPSARVLNVKLFLGNEVYNVDENNVLLMPFGQLIAHDITGLPNNIISFKNGTSIDCCSIENKKKKIPGCLLFLENEPDDPVYGLNNNTCTTLFRAKTSKDYDCPLYPATFINTNSHFIDASEVYGSNESYAQHLRTMEGGRLNFSIADNGQMFCPFLGNQSKEQLNNGNQGGNIKYDTGDPNNGNQNLGITTMQTLFLRFHNYVALKLSLLNPFWSDEIVYQESRRIIIATIQRIAYEDFLPIIIGDDFQEIYGLNKPNIYDPTVNPSTSQELSSAAFRILHAIIPVQFNLMDKNYKVESSVKITDWMVNSFLIPLSNNFDELLKGFIETPGRMVQPSYNFFVSNFLFQSTRKSLRNDLLSIDISRGRDVGLQPYNKVRHFCGYPLAKDFEDLADLIHIKDIAKLKEHYNSVDDVDLMVGILLEKHCDGAIIGPTSRCLIADGFYRSKVGDRFFYDVQGQPGSFTSGQLKLIKKITLGHVICATSNVDHVQKDMFKIIDHDLFPTLKRKCDPEFYLDFKEWEEPNNDQLEL